MLAPGPQIWSRLMAPQPHRQDFISRKSATAGRIMTVQPVDYVHTQTSFPYRHTLINI
jgi:hypothetical protein